MQIDSRNFEILRKMFSDQPKFRAWDFLRKTMLVDVAPFEGKVYYIPSEQEPEVWRHLIPDPFSWHVATHFILMQDIRKSDVDGELIFTGDILEISDQFYLVCPAIGGFVLKKLALDTKNKAVEIANRGSFGARFFLPGDSKKIGNIFEYHFTPLNKENSPK